MPLQLDIPYSDKEEAKVLGAKWNPELKFWYVENKIDYIKFSKWIIGNKEYANIIYDNLYIVEGERCCPYCNKDNKVIALAADKLLEIQKIYSKTDFPYTYLNFDMLFFYFVDELPQNILKFIKEKYNCYYEFDDEFYGKYLTNHCSFCNRILQEDYYLYDNFDKNSPFRYNRDKKINKLIFYKINLKYDFVTHVEYVDDGDEIKTLFDYTCLNLEV